MKHRLSLAVLSVGLWCGIATAKPFLTSDVVPLTAPQPIDYLISMSGSSTQITVPATLTATGAMLHWDVSTLEPGVNTITVQARNAGGVSDPTVFYVLYSSPVIVNDNGKYRNYGFSQELRIQDVIPVALANRDIGAVTITGDYTLTGGVITIKGDGSDIWGMSDAFHFAYKPLVGDGTITVRVVMLTNSDGWTKAGVMIRETLTAGSKHALVAVTPSNGIAFQRRLSVNGASSHSSGAAVKAPYWVRLSRVGSLFTAYQSRDGATWSRIGTATISMVGSVYAGLAITSHKTGVLATATMDSFTVQ